MKVPLAKAAQQDGSSQPYRLLQFFLRRHQIRPHKVPPKRRMRAPSPLVKRLIITRENLMRRRARLCQSAFEVLFLRGFFRQTGDSQTLEFVSNGGRGRKAGEHRGRQG